jgi:hypothetical protein
MPIEEIKLQKCRNVHVYMDVYIWKYESLYRCICMYGCVLVYVCMYIYVCECMWGFFVFFIKQDFSFKDGNKFTIK